MKRTLHGVYCQYLPVLVLPAMFFLAAVLFQSGDCGFDIGRDGRFNRHAFASDGMIELDRSSVQRLTTQ